MKITVLTGVGETEFGSNICLARALRAVGHEVWIVGPNYHNTYGTQAVLAREADVILKDTAYPHYYTYGEVLNVSPWTPEVVFAIDPRGALTGEKPEGVLSCFYSTDAHRAGELHARIIKEGSYDIVFVGQGAYLPFFTQLAPIARTVTVLWPAVEASRFPSGTRDKPVCDITFVGHSGIAPVERFIEGQRYSGLPPSYDYAERAELLLRLGDDFDVRIYENVWKTPNFCQTLQQGRIGFNRSILHDCSIRNFEVMASGRPLVTDDVCLPPTLPRFRDLMAADSCTHIYPSLYRPFYPNFSVEYAYVKQTIQWLLANEPLRTSMGSKARDYALRSHTWKNRAEQVTKTLQDHMRSV